MTPKQRYNPDLYHARSGGVTTRLDTGETQEIWTVEGPTGQMYGRYQGSYTLVAPDRWGKRRLRELPAQAFKLRAVIDAAIEKAQARKRTGPGA